MHKRARILAVGTSLPEKIVTNEHYASYLETSDAWIVRMTGISERRIVDPLLPDSAATLGTEAAKIALARAGISAADVDGIIVPTFSPDNIFPSTACTIAERLGCRKGVFAFDLSAACAGFVYGLTVANALVVSGQSKTILVIGAEVTSRTVNWDDRGTAPLFGDGAGAVVITAATGDEGILSCDMAADPTLGDILRLPLWSEESKMYMNGHEVFKNAVRLMSASTTAAIEKAGLTFDDIDLLIPHQANIRIIKAIGEYLKLPEDRVVVNVDRYGNTSSASIPIALNEAWEKGMITPGKTVVLTGLGGGVTYGSAVIRF